MTSKKEFKYSALFTALLAAGLIFIIMLPSLIRFDGIFIIRGDYVDQFIFKSVKARRMLLDGFGSWDWTNFLGTPYISWETFFSFNSLCLFFPEKYIPQAVTLCNMLRFSVAALICYGYLQRMTDNKKHRALGALLYSFSSYFIVNLEFMQFVDSAALFPLLLIAAEDLFTAKKYGHTLIFASFLCAFTSFYFYVSSTLLFSVYFGARFFFGEDIKAKRTLKTFAAAVFEYALGFLMSAATTFPFMYQVMNSAGSTNALKEKISWVTLFADQMIFTKLWMLFSPAASNRFDSFFGYSQWKSMGGYLPVFGAAFAIAFVLKNRLRRWESKYLLAMSAVVVLPFLSKLFNLYTSAYTRWWYGFVLCLVLVTVRFLDDYDAKNARRGLIISVFTLAALLAAHAIFGYLSKTIGFLNRVFPVYTSAEHDVGHILRIYAVVLTVCFYAVLAAYCRIGFVKRHIVAFTAVLAALYGLSFVWINNTDRHLLDFVEGDPITLEEQTAAYFGGKPELEKAPRYSYRIDAPNYVNNYAAAADKASISAFSSMRSAYGDKITEPLDLYGGAGRVRVFPQTDDNLSRVLLSVKYYVNPFPGEETVKAPKGFVFVKNSNGAEVYENPDFLPFGFAYDRYMTLSEFEKISAGKQNSADVLLGALVVNDGDEGRVSDILAHSAACGAFDLDAVIADRKNHCCDFFEGNARGFKAHISLPAEKMIFFSVPYEKRGWSAYINGEKTGILNAGVAFMALRVPAGDSDIEFVYRHPALEPGLWVSLISALAAAAYISLNKRKGQRT